MAVPDEATPHILIVDDDTRIRELLKKYLADNGYRTSAAADASQAQEKMAALAYDLLVLDVMMPGINGLEFTERLRKQQNAVPILLLTARAEVEQRIEGLMMGADDYLPKPFDPKELLLRVQNILRRSLSEDDLLDPPKEISFGDFVFIYASGELTKAGTRIMLTTRDIELLRHLTAAPGRIVSRLKLAHGEHISERAVDVQINRLRRKIEADPRDPLYLQTVRGSGYVLRVDQKNVV
ncbi:MAG: response regulator transcription factor [PS1 clade bacterium]|nr:response regulator transcription factor [PS1 clade bacterium]CAI8378444.1 MAG: Transcriptional regulatory protein OmpR [Rhodobiaceae bacterium UBA7378]|tara:strand:+ start:898 stop:1611 length:714 start_codon:yes stop_codon:yes gene_type:complete